jgi:hypothetical protein
MYQEEEMFDRASRLSTWHGAEGQARQGIEWSFLHGPRPMTALLAPPSPSAVHLRLHPRLCSIRKVIAVKRAP